MPSTVVIVLPKPMCALSSSTPRTLAMPAPGCAVIWRPGIAFSHMPFSAPPSGTHTPPCGPVMKMSCCAEAGAAKAAVASAAAHAATMRDARTMNFLLLELPGRTPRGLRRLWIFAPGRVKRALSLQPRLHPAEPALGGGLRLVLAADPAFVSDAVDVPEEKIVVDLARSRLVTPRVVGELHVRDLREVLFDRPREIAFHDLHVVDVVLQEEIVRPDLFDDLQRL